MFFSIINLRRFKSTYFRLLRIALRILVAGNLNIFIKLYSKQKIILPLKIWFICLSFASFSKDCFSCFVILLVLHIINKKEYLIIALFYEQKKSFHRFMFNSFSGCEHRYQQSWKPCNIDHILDI